MNKHKESDEKVSSYGVFRPSFFSRFFITEQDSMLLKKAGIPTGKHRVDEIICSRRHSFDQVMLSETPQRSAIQIRSSKHRTHSHDKFECQRDPTVPTQSKFIEVVPPLRAAVNFKSSATEKLKVPVDIDEEETKLQGEQKKRKE